MLDMEIIQTRRQQTGLMRFYVPYQMWVALGAFLLLAFVMREDLIDRFQSHVSLNGLILCTAITVVCLTFRNVFRIQAAANYIKKIDAFEDQPDEAVQQKLLEELRTKGSYIYTFHFQKSLSEFVVGESKNIQFTDGEAKLIKSKIGFRANTMRNTVQYLAGVLVMLGLIGTFWGLLDTITAVGEAMGGLTSNFEEEGGMEKFLTSISKPLQGMGVAFSASLFGLSGSLLGGLLNSFCGKGMNKFIEHFGIWIDTRIPVAKASKQKKLDPVKLIEKHNNTVVTALEKALGGLSEQSQAMFVQMSGVMIEFAKFSEQQQQAIKVIGNESKINVRLADSMEQAVFGLQQEARTLREKLANLPDIQKDLATEVYQATTAIVEGQDRVAVHIEQSAKQSEQTRSTLNNLLSAYAAQVSLMERLVQQGVLEQEAPQTTHIILEMQQVLKQQLEAANSQNINLKTGTVG